MFTRSAKINLIWLVAIAAGAGLLFVGPILQKQAYHDFADKRCLVGICNFADVITNVPFLLIGALGMLKSGEVVSSPGRLRYWRTLFFGVALIGLGSGYYHLNPSDSTLLWDRLPMTIAFMALLTLVIDERIGKVAAARFFPVLLSLGVASVLVWRFGSGDLRFYGYVQFFPMLATALLLLLFPGPAKVVRQYLGAMVCYALAKVLEHSDVVVFDWLGVLSGHSLKHIAAAVALWFLYRLMNVGEQGSAASCVESKVGAP